ncbi:hypothetical protein P7C70_g4966, partial [Phenoliferia sp. Uapishka_3]
MASTYAPLFDVPDVDDDTEGTPIPLHDLSGSVSASTSATPTSPTRHRSSHHLHDHASDDEEELEDSDHEVYGLMGKGKKRPPGSPNPELAVGADGKEEDIEAPLFKDEDNDLDTTMIWPSTLVLVTLFETLHGGAKDSIKETRDRMRFFSISFLGIFTWQFLPAVVFPTLTSIAVLCLLDNNNFVMRTLGSGYDGFGLLDFSLDWSVIGGTGALYTPFFAQASYFLGLAMNMWVITPLLYFSNFWNAKSFDSPLAAHLYNSTFGRFDVKEILNPDLSLNETRFAEIQPILLTPYFALSYGVSFAVLTSAIATVCLWHLDDIKKAFSNTDAEADIHVESKLHALLEDVAKKADVRSVIQCLNGPTHQSHPRRFISVSHSVINSLIDVDNKVLPHRPRRKPYLRNTLDVVLATSATRLGTLPCDPHGCSFFDSSGRTWILFKIDIRVVLMFFVEQIIAAITNTTLGLNVITEFVAGYLFPGKPIANIVFKVYGYMTLVQCIDLTADMKLGLYCKIPPRALFICQVYGTALGSIVNYSLIRGVIDSKRPYLDGTIVDPTSQWSGRAPEIFMRPVTDSQYSNTNCKHIRKGASVIWGLVAPARFFSGQYAVLYWGFLIGALLPVIPWVMHKRYGGPFWRKISIPLILHGKEWWGNSAVDTEHCRPGS